MLAPKFLAVFIGLTLLFFSCGPSMSLVHAQSGVPFAESRQAGEDVEFQITTSVGLSLSGFEYSYGFGLYDQNGFAYDTWNVLSSGPGVADTVGISDNQLADMKVHFENAKQQMVGQLLASTVDDQERANLADKFRELDAQMFGMLTPEQQDRFEVTRTKLEIESVGMENFIASERNQKMLGIQPDQASSAVEQLAQLKQRVKSQAAKIIRRGNQELLDTTTETQQQQFRSLMGDDSLNSFLSQPMFADQKVRKFRSLRTPDYVRTLAYRKSMRDRLEVTGQQLQQIQSIRKQELTREAATDALVDVLTTGQLEQLGRWHVMQEVSKYGTVLALCSGDAARHLSLSDKEAELLFVTGREIADAIESELRESRVAILRKALSEFPVAAQEQIVAALHGAE